MAGQAAASILPVAGQAAAADTSSTAVVGTGYSDQKSAAVAQPATGQAVVAS